MFVCSECGHREDHAGTCPDDDRPLHATDDALLGIEVGRYRLARAIGEGGMGRVYLGVQRAIGSRVAIKVLSEQCSKDAELVERFFAEARAVNLIRHERIVAVMDMDLLPNGRPYIVMEYIEGATLAHLVRNTHAPLGGVAEVVGEILSALAAAHAIGIVHRDLKPDNVLITAAGHAKVLDFGIAKLAPGLHGTNSPRTATGALLGTPAYMAPEQITGSHVDARSDVYAAGILLYECVTGRPPFAGATLYDLMHAHVEQPPPIARQLRPDLPIEIEHVITIALAKDPARRFESAGAMAVALEAAAQKLPDEAWRSLASPAAIARRRNFSDPPVQTPLAPSVVVGPTLPATTPPPPLTPPGVVQPRSQRLALAVGLLGVTGAAVALTMNALREDPQPPQPQPLPSPPIVLTLAPDAALAAAPAPDAGSAVAQPRPQPPKRDHATETIRIGPNVTIGGNTQIGGEAITQPGTRIEVHMDDPTFRGNGRITTKPDYQPSDFDPLGWLATARARARDLMPDAELTELKAYNVASNGHVDLTKSAARYGTAYTFRSAKRSVRPEDVPRGTKLDERCRVIVEARRDAVVAFVVAGGCDTVIVPRPRCKLTDIWQRAIGAGVASSIVGELTMRDSRWWFVDDKAISYESADNCT